MMPRDARSLQLKAVEELVEKAKTASELTFKAPTGSGKTFMMADMMDRMLKENENLIFLVSTLSKGGLAGQNFEAFLSYQEQGRFPHLKPYLINTETSFEEGVFIPASYNVYVLARDLYKKHGKLMQGPMDLFLRSVTGDLFTSSLGKQIYLVKDECHQATNNLDAISKSYFTKTFNFSATPKLGRGKQADVEIKEEDAVAAHLIKGVSWQDEKESLEEALYTYLKVKDEYEKRLGMVPCLIVQISNKDKAEHEWEELIEPALARRNITYMYIVDKDKDCKTNSHYKGKPVSFWKKEVRRATSPVEVVVFKLAVSEGWDIPRANMLYQIRDTKSKQLDEQVLGRVRRNPVLLDFDAFDAEAQDLATKAWAWGLKTDDGQEAVRVRLASETVQDEIRLHTTEIEDFTRGKRKLDVEKLVDRKSKIAGKSIFELQKEYERTTPEVRALAQGFVKNYQDWFAFGESINKIKKAYTDATCNYEKSMHLALDEAGAPVSVTVPMEAYFVKADAPEVVINDHMWRRLDGANSFYFDSKAESDFAKALRDMAAACAKNDPGTLETVYLWGKNYPADIRFAYYAGGVHFSYPDFILKDKQEHIHIFEVKSVNDGGRFTAEQEAEYTEKVQELRRAYKRASELTDYFFYLPVQRGADWQIWRYEQGEERVLTLDTLRKALCG